MTTSTKFHLENRQLKNFLRVTTLCVFLFSPVAAYADNSLSQTECQKLKKDIVTYVKDRLAEKDYLAIDRAKDKADGYVSWVDVKGYGRASCALNVYEHLCSSD